MNAHASALLHKIEAEVDARGGASAFKLHALQHLELKRVIKESHCSPVHQLAFNHTSPALENLMATVGGDQATVYDDSHMGDHPAVVVQFSNTGTAHHKGGVRGFGEGGYRHAIMHAMRGKYPPCSRHLP